MAKRRGKTWVGPYDYERGGREIHVKGHDTHFIEGPPDTFVVLYREKDVVLPGGTKHDQHRAHNRWKHRGPFDEARAHEVARTLMGTGYHARVERLGGGRDEGETVGDLEQKAYAEDFDRER